MTSAVAAGTGLVVHHGSQVERLLARLVTSLRDEPPADPFTPVTIMVQSRGIERWLSHQIAQHLDPAGGGIAANLRFPFPGRVVRELAQLALTDEPEEDPWQPDRLVWPVLELLHEHRREPQLLRLARYLDAADTEGDVEVVDRRAWRFARRLADVLESYILARPRMIEAWSEGSDLGPDLAPIDERERWQPWFWRQLVARVGVDPAGRMRALLEALDEPHGVALPPELTDLRSFGISVLPAAQLDLLTALARRTRVELFVPIASGRRWAAVGDAALDGGPRPRAAHPLVIASGRLGDDAAHLFQRRPARFHDVDAADDGLDRPQRLLGRLQAGIRDDRLPAADELAPLDPDDRSVRIHRCYGPARQTEVLRDALLGLLAEHEELEPRDILIMTPDLPTFAPLVQAAFVGGGAVPDLPVRIADRRLGATNPVADALVGLLGAATGRATAAQLLDLLGQPPVAQRFGLDTAMIEQAAAWVVETGIRWGFDREDRTRHGQPADRAHTWRFGLDRLLLGAVMADEDRRIVGDVTPFDAVEGDGVLLAGRLAEAIRAIEATARSLRAPRPAAAWREALDAALLRCVGVEPQDQWQVEEVRAQVAEVLGGADDTSAPQLGLDATQAVVAAAMEQPRPTAGYETGAATLCELVPMRSIPHRVVCLLGIDDGAFPRTERRPGFDLLERHDEVGDRDKRREDRSLFLEAVLAARQHLLVLTSGWDVRTGQDRPPAVPLAELLETIDRTAKGEPTASAEITVDHPLHPFSPLAFDGGRRDGPTSFDADLRDAAAQARSVSRSATPLVTDTLRSRQEETDVEVVPLRDLLIAVTHPSRYLLRERLRVDLREEVTEVVDLEPVVVDGLEKSRLGREILGVGPDERWLAATLASGAVPAGTPGRLALREVGDEVAQMREQVAESAATVGLDPARSRLYDDGAQHLEVTLGDRVVVGDVGGLHRVDATGRWVRVRARFARRNPVHLLELWVVHLVLTAAGLEPLASVEVTRGPASSRNAHRWNLGPVEPDAEAARRTARSHLERLLDLRDMADRGPVPLFPRACYAYLTSRSGRGPLAAAAEAFAPEFGHGGDNDEYVQELYGPEATLDDVLVDADTTGRFETLTRRIWAPAIAANDACDLRDLAALEDGAVAGRREDAT